jgi:hypothetical protein
MRSPRRFATAVILAAVMAVPAATLAPFAGSALGLQKTTIRFFAPPMAEQHKTAHLWGDVNPARGSNATVKLQRLVNGSWQTVAHLAVLHGAAYDTNLSVPKSGWRTYRTCVGATSTAAAACSHKRRFFVGNWHYINTITPVSATSGYSTGQGVTDGAPMKHALKFESSSPQTVVFNLHGTCVYASVRYSVDDSAEQNGVANGTFKFYEDGALVGTYPISPGPAYDLQVKPEGVKLFKITTSATGDPGYHGPLLLSFADAFCGW